jgi:hypothetical protein
MSSVQDEISVLNSLVYSHSMRYLNIPENRIEITVFE